MNQQDKNCLQIEKNIFLLNTENTSYMFRISEYGHLEHIHYGRKIDIKDCEAMALKRPIVYGDSLMYGNDDTYCLDVVPLEYSGTGRGDFRVSPIEIKCGNGSYTTDFRYKEYKIIDGDTRIKGLPNSYGANKTLEIILEDQEASLEISLYYAVYYDTDVITRRIELTNHDKRKAQIHKLMSLSLDIHEGDLKLMSFMGGWANEVKPQEDHLDVGEHVIATRVGFSSSRANPGFVLKKKTTLENYGEAWGFNLVYSGNHHSSISKDEHGNTRIMTGINPEDFCLELGRNESFATPEAIMTFSDKGLNGMSQHFHSFINEHIVRSAWKKKERPILINDWEAYMFDFNKTKLIALAKEAVSLGFELFVLDDGWFGKRNSDKAGLGDYSVNTKKLPGGIKALSEEIHKLGLKFGLWFEPEAINPDSDLYRAHPDWAMSESNREVIYGRNELLLDLTKKEVRDYIIDNVSRILDEGNVDYVKWDMNRQMAYKGGDYGHRYIVSLYEILDEIFTKRPHILFESCSSGGNRFDLGMLCYSPQIWSSDNTDAIERLRIQKSLSYLYPQSCMGAHVSAVPNAQTLRNVPLHTRFNVAAYGAFGYELDLTALSSLEKKEVKKQLAFYKQYRYLFQFGRFYRFDLDDENRESFEVCDEDKAIVSLYRKYCPAAPEADVLKAAGLAEGRYHIASRVYTLNIKQFGHLINFVTPIKVNADGLVVREAAKRLGMEVPSEEYEASANCLEQGIILNNTFLGTGYNPKIKLPCDYGSDMYIITKLSDPLMEEKQ